MRMFPRTPVSRFAFSLTALALAGAASAQTTWTKQTSNSTKPLNAAVWTGSKIVAVGDPKIQVTSPDGVAWTASEGPNAEIDAIAWTGNSLVAVGSGGKIFTSADAAVWEEQVSGTTQTLKSVAFGAGTLVAVGSLGTVVSSPDGVTWTVRPAGTSNPLNAVVRTDSLWVALGGTTSQSSAAACRVSADAVVWTACDAVSANSLNDAIWSGTQVVAVGNGIIRTSPTGNLFASPTLTAAANYQAVAWSGSNYVAVGGRSAVSVSADGVAWTDGLLLPDNTQLFHDVIKAGNQLVAVGSNGNIVTSPIVGGSAIRRPRSGAAAEAGLRLAVSPTLLIAFLPESMAGKAVTAVVFGLDGSKKSAFEGKAPANGLRLPINGLPHGKYLLEVTGLEGKLSRAFEL